MHIYARSCMFVQASCVFRACQGPEMPMRKPPKCNENVKSPKKMAAGATGSIAAARAVSADRRFAKGACFSASADAGISYGAEPHSTCASRLRLRRSPHGGRTPSKCPVRGTRPLPFFGFLGLELSSQVQQLIEEDFKRGSPAEAFAWAKINLVSKSIEEGGNKGF